MPNCRNLSLPYPDLCQHSGLWLETHLDCRRCCPCKLLPPCCHVFGRTIVLLSGSENNLFSLPPFFNQWVPSQLVSRALAAAVPSPALSPDCPRRAANWSGWRLCNELLCCVQVKGHGCVTAASNTPRTMGKQLFC